MTQWTDAAVAHLRRLHAEGLIFVEIQRQLAELGIMVSRNAAIGKARRLGLPLRYDHREAEATGIKTSYAPVRAKPRALPTYPARREHVPLVDLARDGCRFPFGNLPYLYCNDPQAPGSSYCREHHDLTHNAPYGKNR